MSLKNLSILVAVLALASLGVFFMNRPSPPPVTDPRVGQPLLATDTATKAAHVKISDNGKSVELARQSDGSWTDVSYYDLPADFSKLSRLVTDLTDAKVERVVTRDPEKLARLQFKDTKISLADESDKSLWAVTLGKNADGGGRFVQFADAPTGYLSRVNVYLDAEPKNWADSRLLDLKPEAVAKVTLTFPEGEPVTVSRAKKEDPFAAENAPDGQQLKTSTVTNLVNSIGGLRFTDTSANDDEKARAAREHSRAITLTTFDGHTLSVELGRKPEATVLDAPPAAEKPADAAKAATELLAKAEKNETPAEKPEDKPTTPAAKTKTIPAGPVFAFITDSDATAPINRMMKARAFQISDYTFTSLPKTRADLFEPKPAPAPAKAAATPATGAQIEKKNGRISVTTPPISVPMPPAKTTESTTATSGETKPASEPAPKP